MKYEIEFYENGIIKKMTISSFWTTVKGRFTYNKEDGFRDEKMCKYG